jgi:hypothetical protein
MGSIRTCNTFFNGSNTMVNRVRARPEGPRWDRLRRLRLPVRLSSDLEVSRSIFAPTWKCLSPSSLRLGSLSPSHPTWKCLHPTSLRLGSVSIRLRSDLEVSLSISSNLEVSRSIFAPTWKCLHLTSRQTGSSDISEVEDISQTSLRHLESGRHLQSVQGE